MPPSTMKQPVWLAQSAPRQTLWVHLSRIWSMETLHLLAAAPEAPMSKTFPTFTGRRLHPKPCICRRPHKSCPLCACPLQQLSRPEVRIPIATPTTTSLLPISVRRSPLSTTTWRWPWNPSCSTPRAGQEAVPIGRVTEEQTAPSAEAQRMIPSPSLLKTPH